MRFPGRRATIRAPTRAKASAYSVLRRIHQPSTTARSSGEMSLVGVAPRRALPAMNSATVAMTLAPASRFARLRRKPTIDLILLDSRKERGRSDAETGARRGRARPTKDKKPVTRRNEIARLRLTHYAPPVRRNVAEDSRTDHGGCYAIRGIVRSHHYSTDRTEGRGRGGLGAVH